MGHVLGCSGVSGNHQGAANRDSQVDGDSDMAPASSVKGGLRKGTMASAGTSVWEKAVSGAVEAVIPALELRK